MGWKRSTESKIRLKKLYKETKHSGCAGAWYHPDKQRYIQYSALSTPGYAKSLRRVSNKRVRRQMRVLNHGAYRKVYDYWWILF